MLKLKAKKAQTSIELLIVVSGCLLFFIIFLSVIQSNIGDKIREKNILEVTNIAYQIQDEIALAFQSSEGYSRNFILPNTAASMDYDALILDNIIYVKTTEGKIALTLPISNATGILVKGTNHIEKQNNTIRLNI